LADCEESLQEEIIPEISDHKLTTAISSLENDDAAALLDKVAPDVQARVLKSIPDDLRQEILEVLAYPKDTAGSIMQSIVLTLRPKTQVNTVLRYLRRFGPLPSNLNSLYVVDGVSRLQGEIFINDLIALDPDDNISNCIHTDYISIPANTDQEEVGRIFQRYALISSPVINDNNKLIGRITVDDVMDVIKEEAEEDLLRLGGLQQNEDLMGSAFNMTLRRVSWLFINLIMALIASVVIGQFDTTIEKIVALAILMPIVASLSGNVGNQTLTAVIRAQTLDQIKAHNYLSLIFKQSFVGFMIGSLWAFVVGTIVYIWFDDPHLGMVMAASMIINLSIAGTLGAIIPIFLNKIKIDPALAAGVILTASTDIIAFFSFLSLASYFLTS